MADTSKAAAICEQLVRMGNEFAELRRTFLRLHGAELAKKHPGSLRGIWQGVAINEEDFAAAKASLFPEREKD
jgi:hypothetical protein